MGKQEYINISPPVFRWSPERHLKNIHDNDIRSYYNDRI